MSTFPHVRGHLLAKHLAALGAAAEFRTLPVDGTYDVAICSDYQGNERWLGELQARMGGLRAERFFCMVDISTAGRESEAMARWFGAHGGVLSHLRERPLADYEHYIGVGVDVAGQFAARRPRTSVLFDFPRTSTIDVAPTFARTRLDAVRQAYPELRLLGTGPADAPIRDWFDAWIAYGVPHDDYLQSFAGCCAFVPGCAESLGLAVAEAQAAGCAIVAPPGWIKTEMLVPAAAVLDADLVRGLGAARTSRGQAIASAAAERFSPQAMARRVLVAIGAGDLTTAPPHR